MTRMVFTALAVLILFGKARADDNGNFFESEDQISSKISTSLRIGNGHLKNRTEMIQGTVSTGLPMTEKEAIAERALRGNTTRDLVLPTDLSIARIITEDTPEEEDLGETLPEAQELRFQRPGTRRRPLYRPNPPRRPTNQPTNRRNVFPVEGPLRSPMRPNRRPQEIREARQPTESDCTFFTKTVCLETINYPHEAIARSLRGNKDMVSSLLTDFSPQDNNYPKALPLESHVDNRFENKYENNEIKRRSDHSSFDNFEEGFTCPSQVMYARPQLARAVSGVWKYIVNTAEHTQTLRLEKCSSPKSSCSFISENYRSSCMQVYNYHRLLTWDSSLGLHMDIFKVPSCCSCHVQGYAELYPPIQKDPRPTPDEKFPGADFATEQGEDDAFKRPTSYLTKFKPSNPDNNFVSSGGNKHIADAGSSHRPSFALPGRQNRPKKPSSPANPRPYDKLPQQHAPNTRAPGYKGPAKGVKRPGRPVRPYRRESTGDEETSPAPINEGIEQQNDQETDASLKLHNGGFDEEYQEPNRRVNYNYHPIIDFFKPEASRLQAPEALSTQPATIESTGNSWKPMISA
ncbi:uncharacterized protein [Fopius arisanus]|uniref:Spz_3 protein n=1 Tax=Fopius arisanus TaxID=64838 RepID=A0A0C9PVH7_9HYME|nr:PREDICTED: uncharacterized protein LOC105266134 isoform X1 [Fopius arisanus]